MTVTRPNWKKQSRKEVVDWPYIYENNWDQDIWEGWNIDKIEYYKQSNTWWLYNWWKEKLFKSLIEEENFLSVNEFEIFIK